MKKLPTKKELLKAIKMAKAEIAEWEGFLERCNKMLALKNKK